MAMHLELVGQARTVGERGRDIPSSVVPLLAVLATTSQVGVHRDRLVEMLWPDQPADKVRSRLSTTVWRLRDALDEGSGSGEALEVSSCGTVALGRAVVVDIADLVTIAHTPPGQMDGLSNESLTRAATVTVEEVFAGNFHDVVVRSRERLRMAHMRAMLGLMKRRTTEGDLDGAIWWGRRIVETDPYREDVHRKLIHLLRSVGRPREAQEQFARCCEVLRTELGVEPTPETTAALDGGYEPSSQPVIDLRDGAPAGGLAGSTGSSLSASPQAPAAMHAQLAEVEATCRRAADQLLAAMAEIRTIL